MAREGSGSSLPKGKFKQAYQKKSLITSTTSPV